jgi:hypothetical protein
MENLARYIIRVSLSQERMTYLDHEAKDVLYIEGRQIHDIPRLQFKSSYLLKNRIR